MENELKPIEEYSFNFVDITFQLSNKNYSVRGNETPIRAAIRDAIDLDIDFKIYGCTGLELDEGLLDTLVNTLEITTIQRFLNKKDAVKIAMKLDNLASSGWPLPFSADARLLCAWA